MREFIGRAAEERPLLLVLEDLHWADESTLLLLEYLAPNLPEMPVMIVGTFRDDEVAPASPLARILNQLVRERLVTRVPLRRLPEEVQRHTAQQYARELPALAERLFGAYRRMLDSEEPVAEFERKLPCIKI